MVPPIQNIQEFRNSGQILAKCTPATVPAEYIEVKYQKEQFEDDSLHMQLQCEGLVFPFSASPVITAPIADSKILYQAGISSKKIVEISLDISGLTDYAFAPGDAIGVLVSNCSRDVERVFMALSATDSASIGDLCQIAVNSRTSKKNAKIPQHVPVLSSARAILRDCLDLRSVPKKLFLRSLAEYTRDENEKQWLISVSSKEGSKLYSELILEKSRTFLDILDICPRCCPSLALLIEHLPRLKPRPYSIANSPLEGTGRVDIIFSVLPENPGVATRFLAKLAAKFIECPDTPPKLNFYFRERNKFSFGEEEAKSNTILVAVGCGVSPFLGFLEHKQLLAKQSSVDLGASWLFVGSTCQESAVHREQLLEYKKTGVLQELYESFSRDAECKDFNYVQDQIRAIAAEFVMQYGKQDTILYVCADGAKISKSIEDCIKQCFVEVFECTEGEAAEMIKQSRASGKYREDVWV